MRIPPTLLLLLLPSIFLLPQFPTKASAQPALPIEKTWGGSGDEGGNGIALDSLGNIYVVGSTSSFGGGLTLLKYSATGSLLWEKLYSNSSGTSIATDSSDNIYVTGTTTLGTGGSLDVLLMKIAANGTLVWQRAWGGSSFDIGYSVRVDSTSGSIYVAGMTNDTPFLLKFSSFGDVFWQKTFTGGSSSGNEGCPFKESFSDIASSGLVVDSSGNAYVGVLNKDLYVILPNGNPACIGGASLLTENILKFNSTGSITGGASLAADYGGSIALDATGNLYFVGSRGLYGAGLQDVLIAKYAPNGTNLWQRTWGGTKNDYGTSLAVNATTGDLYVTGYTYSFGAGGADVFLLRLSSSGDLRWSMVWGVAKEDHGNAVVVDPSGDALVTGYISEAPPQSLSYGNSTLITKKVGGYHGSLCCNNPSILVSTPGGTISSPAGSESYAGGADEFLFRYGSLHSISFATSPGVGHVTFNSTFYANGESGNYTEGTAALYAFPPKGYKFTGWSTAGGVSVTNNSTNPTTAIIKGPGTLTAHFASLNSAAFTPTITLLTLVTTTTLIMIKRRRNAR